MGTRRYLISKVLQAVLTLLFVLVFNFFLFRGLGDPTQLLAKQRGSLTPVALSQLRSELGLDLPLPQQFANYLKQSVQGNLGLTFDNQPVSSEIAHAIWPTVLPSYCLSAGFSTDTTMALRARLVHLRPNLSSCLNAVRNPASA